MIIIFEAEKPNKILIVPKSFAKAGPGSVDWCIQFGRNGTIPNFIGSKQSPILEAITGVNFQEVEMNWLICSKN